MFPSGWEPIGCTLRGWLLMILINHRTMDYRVGEGPSGSVSAAPGPAQSTPRIPPGAFCHPLYQCGDVLEETSLHFHSWATSLVPSGLEIRAREPQAASEHSSIPAPMEKWQWLWAGRSGDALGCTQRESRLQKSALSGSLDLNMRNGIRSVII